MEEQKKSSTWGGARSGAGRKTEGKARKVTVAVTISPESKEKLFAEATIRGLNASKLIEQLIQEL